MNVLFVQLRALLIFAFLCVSYSYGCHGEPIGKKERRGTKLKKTTIDALQNCH